MLCHTLFPHVIASNDGFVEERARHTFGVVLAKARTHNHRTWLLRTTVAASRQDNADAVWVLAFRQDDAEGGGLTPCHIEFMISIMRLK